MFFGYFLVSNFLKTIKINIMKRLMKAVKVTSIMILITIAIITIAAIAYKDSRKKMLERQRDQAILDYYQDVETLLDSLCIYENDSIFKTNVGNKYLESKHKFDSLIINNK